jgi:thiol-disulfide isomerase/thioredoxin
VAPNIDAQGGFMKRLMGFGLCSLLVFVCGDSMGQEKGDGVTLKVVKYDGLKETIVKNRGKVVLVDFWADFCKPCKDHFPHVVELHKKHEKEGLAVISVALDDVKEFPEAKNNVLKFLKAKGASFTNLLLDEPLEIWQQKLRFDGPPSYFVFNRQGKWTHFKSEGVAEIDYAAMDKLVLELLKSKE